MGAQNAKLVREVARDSKALLQGTSKATLNQLKARRVAMEEELQTVIKHKEGLLARRAAAVQSITQDYHARRQRVLEQLQSQQPPPPSASTSAPSATTGSSSTPGLPRPEELVRRVQELQQIQAEEGGRAESGSAAGTKRSEG